MLRTLAGRFWLSWMFVNIIAILLKALFANGSACMPNRAAQCQASA
jgi:hypothetical protein